MVTDYDCWRENDDAIELPAILAQLETREAPLCSSCAEIVKPGVVMFGEVAGVLAVPVCAEGTIPASASPARTRAAGARVFIGAVYVPSS